MNEIEKLYENAGIKDKCGYICSAKGIGCNECPNKNRKFTAEKQLELIKIFAKRELTIDNTDYGFSFSISDGDEFADTYITKKDFSPFENALANLINNLWQDLTSEEKEQVRGILK